MPLLRYHVVILFDFAGDFGVQLGGVSSQGVNHVKLTLQYNSVIDFREWQYVPIVMSKAIRYTWVAQVTRTVNDKD